MYNKSKSGGKKQAVNVKSLEHIDFAAHPKISKKEHMAEKAKHHSGKTMHSSKKK